jgi:hypothetical protein
MLNFVYLQYFNSKSNENHEKSDDEILQILSDINDLKSSVKKLNHQIKQKMNQFNNATFSVEHSFSPPEFPETKDLVMEKILQDAVKKFSLTFVSFVRNFKDIEDVKKLVSSILQTFPSEKILIGSSVDVKISFPDERVRVIQFSKGVNLGRILNKLLDETDSEIALLMKPSSMVDEQTNLQKIFGAFTHTDAIIVSGSNRDINTGELYLPCYRVFLKRWTYQIEYGNSGTLFYKSESPVAICETTEFPVAIKKSLFNNNHKFDELLKDDDMVLEDFYIKMSFHIKSVVTPHTMFHVKRESSKSNNDFLFVDKWISLAIKYKFDNIIGVDGNRKFLCRDEWILPFYNENQKNGHLYTPTCICNEA